MEKKGKKRESTEEQETKGQEEEVNEKCYQKQMGRKSGDQKLVCYRIREINREKEQISLNFFPYH